MKSLKLPSSYNPTAKGAPDEETYIRIGEEVDDDGDLVIEAQDTGDFVTSWINREQATALVAHLTAVFGLEGKNPSSFVQWEDA